MRSRIILVAVLLVVALALAGSNAVFALSRPNDSGADGTISGIVVSPSGNVIDWSQIYARNGNQTFEAFSGFSGFYLMRVPAGLYNVSVFDPYSPQLWAPSMMVNVTAGSSNTVNFYMLAQQPPSAVPEFQPNLLTIMSMLVVVAACLVARRLRKGSVSV